LPLILSHLGKKPHLFSIDSDKPTSIGQLQKLHPFLPCKKPALLQPDAELSKTQNPFVLYRRPWSSQVLPGFKQLLSTELQNVCWFLYLAEVEGQVVIHHNSKNGYVRLRTFPPIFSCTYNSTHQCQRPHGFQGATFAYFTNVQSCNTAWYIIHQEG